MADSIDKKKELIRFVSRIVILILFVITSALFIGYNMTGNTMVDTWCWFTLAVCSEWILEKPLASVISSAKNTLSRIFSKGEK